MNLIFIFTLIIFLFLHHQYFNRILISIDFLELHSNQKIYFLLNSFQEVGRMDRHIFYIRNI